MVTQKKYQTITNIACTIYKASTHRIPLWGPFLKRGTLTCSYELIPWISPYPYSLTLTLQILRKNFTIDVKFQSVNQCYKIMKEHQKMFFFPNVITISLFQPEPSQNQGWLQPAMHSQTFSFPPYGSNEWCYNVEKAVCVWFWTCHPCPRGTAAGQKFGRFQPEPSQNQGWLRQHTQHALPNHFISSIWVQWVMLQCWEGCVCLISDMPCLCDGTAAGKKFGRFHPEPSQNQGWLQPAHPAMHCLTFSFPPYSCGQRPFLGGPQNGTLSDLCCHAWKF
jgi:hypothetical protein